MPIIRPCFNWPLCDGKAYARHASDTTRLCRQCWNVAPKRYGKVYLESSETPVPRKHRHKWRESKIDDFRKWCLCGAVRDLPIERIQRYPLVKPTVNHETQIDAYWEKHPELTRVQVSRR